MSGTGLKPSKGGTSFPPLPSAVSTADGGMGSARQVLGLWTGHYRQNERFLLSKGSRRTRQRSTSFDSFVILLIPISLEDGAEKVCPTDFAPNLSSFGRIKFESSEFYVAVSEGVQRSTVARSLARFCSTASTKCQQRWNYRGKSHGH